MLESPGLTSGSDTTQQESKLKADGKEAEPSLGLIRGELLFSFIFRKVPLVVCQSLCGGSAQILGNPSNFTQM